MDNKNTKFFYWQEPLSPTSYNLRHYLKQGAWEAATTSDLADFGEASLAFDEKAALCLEYKHLLAQLLAKEGQSQLMPATYGINDFNWPAILQRMVAEGHKGPFVWILKPALLNNGQGIRIFQSMAELENHFLSSNRLGGEHVLQRYIHNPHLLRDNRKYSIRQFMLLTNDRGAFVYPEGYYNVALVPFDATNFKDLSPHLTNEHLYGQEPNVIQIPSNRFERYEAIYAQIKKMLSVLVKALQHQYPEAFQAKPKDIPTLALFGVDFMLDAEGRLWLLEVNHGPCFPVEKDHPLQPYLYEGFWKAVVDEFVEPMASEEPNAKAKIFEKL